MDVLCLVLKEVHFNAFTLAFFAFIKAVTCSLLSRAVVREKLRLHYSPSASPFSLKSKTCIAGFENRSKTRHAELSVRGL